MMANPPCRRCGQEKCLMHGLSQYQGGLCPRPGCTPEYEAMMEAARQRAREMQKRRIAEAYDVPPEMIGLCPGATPASPADA